MWDWPIWGALVAGALAGVAALALLVLRARQTWRDFKETRRNLLDQLDDFTAKAEATADRIEAAGDTAELQESLGRLRLSLARLAVLRDAIDEADHTFGRMVAFIPRK